MQLHPVSAEIPFECIEVAELLAAVKAIDKVWSLLREYEKLFVVCTKPVHLDNLENLYSTLSSQRRCIDRSTRGNVVPIIFEVDPKFMNQFAGITGKINPADIAIRLGILLSFAVNRILISSRIRFHFNATET